MPERNKRPEVPFGLGYALAMNNKALEKFAELSEEHRKQVVDASRGIATKKEMQNFVDNFGSDSWHA